MVNQNIEVEVNIADNDRAKQKMTNILIDLIKFRLNKYPPSSQGLICDLILYNTNTSEDTF